MATASEELKRLKVNGASGPQETRLRQEFSSVSKQRPDVSHGLGIILLGREGERRFEPGVGKETDMCRETKQVTSWE